MQLRKMDFGDVEQVTRLCSQIRYPALTEQIKERFQRIVRSCEHQIFVADIDEISAYGRIYMASIPYDRIPT